jgi:dienelactone hydrolase
MTDLKTVTCDHEGTSLQGQLALPGTPGPHAAVMVMHNAHGLGSQVCDSARRLAQQGYLALATDMYGGGVFHQDPAAASASLGPLWTSPQLQRSRVLAWYEWLKARADVSSERIAAIGYCFGGQCVLELARSGADVKAVVSFHGILTTSMPAQPGAVKAQVAVYTGAEDPYAPPNHVDDFQSEMRSAGAAWQIMSFGGCYHSFTDPHPGPTTLPGIAYHPIADQVSWAGTLALLKAVLASRA